MDDDCLFKFYEISNYFQFYADCGEVATPNFWYARLDYVHNEKNQILQRFRRSDGGGKHSQVAAYLPEIKNICEIKILRLFCEQFTKL